MVPASAGGVVFCFAEDTTPPIIAALIDLAKQKDAVGREEKRDENELYKLLIQRMPIDSDGHLVFELDEVLKYNPSFELISSIFLIYADLLPTLVKESL